MKADIMNITEELVIPGTVWEETGRQLFVDQNRIAFGWLMANPSQRHQEWLVRRLELRAQMPYGPNEVPLSAFAVIVPARFAPRLSARDFAERIQPRMNQRTIVLVVGLGPDADGWDGVIVEHQVMRELPGFRILHPGFPGGSILPAFPEDETIPEDFSRVVGGMTAGAWKTLRQTDVALIGAGRNGSRVAQLLAGLGVRSLTMIDPDRIEASNLDGMDGVTFRDVGKHKVLQVGRFLHRLRPQHLVVSMVPQSVTSVPAMAALKRCSILVTAVDSDTPRLFVSLMAARYLKPHLDLSCGVVRSENGRRLAADCRFLLPGDGCLLCSAGGLPDEENARHELLSSPRTLRSEPQPAWNEQGDRLGSLNTLNSMVCGAAVQLLVDFLAGQNGLSHSFWQRFEWIPGAGLSAIAGRVGPGENCEVCRAFR